MPGKLLLPETAEAVEQLRQDGIEELLRQILREAAEQAWSQGEVIHEVEALIIDFRKRYAASAQDPDGNKAP
jgi:hypothetical protein